MIVIPTKTYCGQIRDILILTYFYTFKYTIQLLPSPHNDTDWEVQVYQYFYEFILFNFTHKH